MMRERKAAPAAAETRDQSLAVAAMWNTDKANPACADTGEREMMSVPIGRRG